MLPFNLGFARKKAPDLQYATAISAYLESLFSNTTHIIDLNLKQRPKKFNFPIKVENYFFQTDFALI